MESTDAIQLLASLAHDGRLSIFRLLMRRAPQAAAAGDIAAALGVRASTLSNQLKELESAGLIESERVGRSVFYRPSMARAGALIEFLAGDCCLGRPDLCLPLAKASAAELGAAPLRTLFVCTRNAARSIFAEVLLATFGGDRFAARSAGAAPSGKIDPLALEVLESHGHEIAGLRSCAWTDFAAASGGAPLDLVVTVCDRAASEERPVWRGTPLSSHWGVPDPAVVTGSSSDRRQAYETAYGALRRKIETLVATPFEQLAPPERQHAIDAIASA